MEGGARGAQLAGLSLPMEGSSWASPRVRALTQLPEDTQDAPEPCDSYQTLDEVPPAHIGNDCDQKTRITGPGYWKWDSTRVCAASHLHGSRQRLRGSSPKDPSVHQQNHHRESLPMGLCTNPSCSCPLGHTLWALLP